MAYYIFPVWVNAVAAGLSTDTVTYSIYPNPYITINGNRWTKHYYIGSERVASRTGAIMGGFNGLHDMDSDVAGSTLQIPVNYDSMCVTEEDSIASMYERFGVPYEVQHANSRGQVAHMYFPITRTDSEGNTVETSGEGSQRSHPDTLGEGPVYFYHRDHLGSTMSVTDSLGNTIQQVEYTPWGEVFVEQRSGNSVFSTPYLFNGKELDEESGLYYYGARYYDPKLSLWYSTDPMQMDYPWVSTYGYCLGNPILYNDINGNYPIILITKIKSWKTAKQRIIGYSGNRIARVPLYFAIVIDTEDENYISVFYVTRDALTVREKDHHGNILGVSNVGFEPKDDKHNRYRAKVMKYPNGSNSLALKLMQDGSETIHAESNEVSVEMNYRKKADVAEGIMLHVGGFYLRYGKPEIAASEGCFGITDGSNNNSNYYTNHVLQSIINQSQKSIDHKGRIDVVIDKRNGDEFKKFKTLIFDK